MNTKPFYKYRSDSEFTDQIFTSGQVYLATAEHLNDPFECSLQEIGRDWIAEKVMEMKQAGVAGFLITAKSSLDNNEGFFGHFGSEIEDILDSARKHSDIKETYDFYVQFIRQHTGQPPSDCSRFFSRIDAQLNSVGIFSMSKRPDHPLMWAHYAAEHTGICIGFETMKDSKMDHSDHFLPVTYSDSLPELNDDGFQTAMTMSMGANGRVHTSSFQIAFSDKTFQAAITTKPTCWRYEEEWRYIEPFPGLFDWPGRISELTFGLKLSDERRKHFVRLAEEHVPNKVRLYEMRKKQGTNALERCRFEKAQTTPRKRKSSTVNKAGDMSEMSPQKFVAQMERLIRKEQYGEALFQIDENLKSNPGDFILLYWKGVAHGYAKEPRKALDCFKQLTEKHPEVSQGWYQLSCALVELGKHEEAISALRRSTTLDPNDASAAFNLGVQLYKVQQSSEEALIHLRRAERLGHRRARQAIAEVESQSR